MLAEELEVYELIEEYMQLHVDTYFNVNVMGDLGPLYEECANLFKIPIGMARSFVLHILQRWRIH
jgi:hypothetical protein